MRVNKVIACLEFDQDELFDLAAILKHDVDRSVQTHWVHHPDAFARDAHMQRIIRMMSRFFCLCGHSDLPDQYIQEWQEQIKTALQKAAQVPV